jgi:arylsulfatase A-like enzyme
MLKKYAIVFILADDLGWNSIGYEDFDMSFATPTLTSMSSKGIIMDSYYAQEVCTPSRAALLTGRYPLTIGMQNGVVSTEGEWGLNIKETTLAQVLSDEGYDNYMLGIMNLKSLLKY